MLNKEALQAAMKDAFIVSCQALPHEPLHSSEIMARMALAAEEGGATALRANSVADIRAIKAVCKLPVIGLIKAEYEGSEVYITPTLREVEALVEAGCEIIATDATARPRPEGLTREAFFTEVRRRFPDQAFMADCATFEEGVAAAELGFDYIGTTLAGYTADTKGRKLPDVDLVSRLVEALPKPVIAEGGIWSLEDLAAVKAARPFAVVIGSAITRPQLIAARYAAAWKQA